MKPKVDTNGNTTCELGKSDKQKLASAAGVLDQRAFYLRDTPKGKEAEKLATDIRSLLAEKEEE
jgi:hypothetical protein